MQGGRGTMAILHQQKTMLNFGKEGAGNTVGER